MARRIKSRRGVFGEIYYYENGRYIGKSRPGLLEDTRVFFDADGNPAGRSRPGIFAERVYWDRESGEYLSVYPGLTGKHLRKNGRFVGKAHPEILGTGYTDLDEEDPCEESLAPPLANATAKGCLWELLGGLILFALVMGFLHSCGVIV